MANRKLFGQILKEAEKVKESQIQEALRIQQKKGGAIGRILMQLGYIKNDDILASLALQFGMKTISLDKTKISPESINKIVPSIARQYKIMPVSLEKNILTVAISNPLNLAILDDISFMGNLSVTPVLCAMESIDSALDKYYPVTSVKENDNKSDVADEGEIFHEIAGEDINDSGPDSEQTPVKKLMNLILQQAIKNRAADIHFEPFEKEFKVRYRLDGVLYEMSPIPLTLASAMISRIKVMANLNIAENRLPQDGRILVNVAGKSVDLRVSTLPTMFGESVVLRVLDKNIIPLDIAHIGLRADEGRVVKNLLNLPNGIIILTGPTGSGKTTTLYSMLSMLNDIKWKIITTEDPVEYDLNGIIQCPIKEEIGVTYASCLRSILRQDPDIILLGEIRDEETARMAVEAALTGHLVLTTLHTNDAPSSITRLLDLGVEPFLITATVEVIIAQRLVRKICPHCKTDYEPTEELLSELSLSPDIIKGKKFYYGKGCPQCNNIGYKGRTGIFEIMLATDRIKQMINSDAFADKIRLVAREEGMRTLRESGLLAVYDGVTTAEEVIRETLFT
jgi:type IV pilus assembly protein PilB